MEVFFLYERPTTPPFPTAHTRTNFSCISKERAKGLEYNLGSITVYNRSYHDVILKDCYSVLQLYSSTPPCSPAQVKVQMDVQWYRAATIRSKTLRANKCLPGFPLGFLITKTKTREKVEVWGSIGERGEVEVKDRYIYPFYYPLQRPKDDIYTSQISVFRRTRWQAT